MREISRLFCRLVGLPAVVLLSAACDPCDGVDACAGTKQVSYQGQVLRKFTDAPADSVRVTFVRTAGAHLSPSDSVTVWTDSVGQFRIEGEVSSSQDVIGRLTIYPPVPIPPIRYEEIHLSPVSAEGETRYLGTWRVAHPYFGNFGLLTLRHTGAFAEGVEVEFRRKGGIRVRPNTYIVKTDVLGRFPLDPVALDTGTVTFDLVIRPPAPLRPTTIEDLTMSTRISAGAPNQLGHWRIGPSLPYLGLLVWGDTRQGAVGVKVHFRRVSGIRIQPESFETETNPWANFSLSPTPLEPGSVTGELTITPPAPYKSFKTMVTLTTREDDAQNVLAGTWEIPRQ